jgi:HD superfamily phosphohydrolase
MDILDNHLAVDVTALSALEAFLLARLQSFKTIYFHRASRAAQIMILKAMDKAKDELKLFDFETTNDYLKLDDYSIWHMLKKCEQSRNMMESIENRKLLKCAYEKTFFIKDQLMTNIFENETVRTKIEGEIASKAGVESDLITIDVPSLPSVPYQYTIEIDPMNIPIFHRISKNEKIPQKISELSRIIDSLRVFMNIVRVYTDDSNRIKVRKASEDIFGKIPTSSLISF